MGMAIDEHIEQLKQMPISSELSEEYLKSIYNTIDFAIDTMRKYQKIEQIIEDWERDKGWALEMSELYWLDRVKEVLEDGND